MSPGPEAAAAAAAGLYCRCRARGKIRSGRLIMQAILSFLAWPASEYCRTNLVLSTPKGEEAGKQGEKSAFIKIR